jgi:hypothetical protein
MSDLGTLRIYANVFDRLTATFISEEIASDQAAECERGEGILEIFPVQRHWKEPPFATIPHWPRSYLK